MIEPTSIDLLVPNSLSETAAKLEIPMDGLIYAAITRRILTGKTNTGMFGAVHRHKTVLSKHTVETIRSHGGQDLEKWVLQALASWYESDGYGDARKWYGTSLPGGGSGKISKTR